MGLFKKAKTTKIIDNTDAVVYDFRLRPPFWSYRPEPYKEYQPFANLEPVIDGFLAKLFAGEIDSGNGNALDNIIDGYARQAESDLNRQRVMHGDTIKAFDIGYKGNRRAFENELALLSDELAKNGAKRSDISSRLEADKFLTGKTAPYSTINLKEIHYNGHGHGHKPENEKENENAVPN